MPFDMGFNFRSTAGYVTDPSYAVPVLAEAYPHTYTAANGYSVNGGWGTPAPTGGLDRASGNDPRIAGSNYNGNGNAPVFTLDLTSGSAPGAGDYATDLAAGDPTATTPNQNFRLKDGTTTLLDQISPVSLAADHYLDATLADVGATTTWTGTATTLTFSTGTVNLQLNPAGLGDKTAVAHLRLTLQSSQSVVPVLMPQYRQRRG